jgi:hypothetical protein
MKLLASTVILLAAGFLAMGAAHAQQPAPAPGQNPLDVVPEKMPFNTPYGTPISLKKAEEAVQAALMEANQRGWSLNIAVVDSGGNLLLFARMDGAQLASIAIAEHKARAAAKFRRPTRVFEEAVQKGHQLHHHARRRGGFARRHSIDRGRQTYRRHRVLGRHRLTRRSGLRRRCGDDQQIAAFLRLSWQRDREFSCACRF